MPGVEDVQPPQGKVLHILGNQDRRHEGCSKAAAAQSCCRHREGDRELILLYIK